MVTKSSASPASVEESGASTKTKAKAGARYSRKTTRAAAKPEDAIKLLKTDHQQVKQWFEEFEKTDDDKKKQKLAHDICHALTVHAQIEEDIFYPAARDADVDDDLLDEANVEHASAKHLISQIEAMDTNDPLFDATVRVLGEYVKHHVAEEENELFPECRESGMDLTALGKKLADRKAQLMAA
jgi:hemerythrin superfamily protein